MGVDDVKEKVREQVKGLLSDEQIDHYTKDCDGNSLDGPARDAEINRIIDEDLIGDPEPVVNPNTGKEICKEGFKVQRDPKTHKKASSHSTLGQMSADVQAATLDYFCKDSDPDPETGKTSRVYDSDSKGRSQEKFHKADKNAKKTEQQMRRMETLEKTLTDCDRNIISDACSFEKAIEDTQLVANELLVKGGWVEGVDNGQETAIEAWVTLQVSMHDEGRGGLSEANARLRGDAAMRCLHQTGRSQTTKKVGLSGGKPKSDCDHLTSMKNSMRNAKLTQLLDDDTDANGTLTGKALNYYKFLYVAIGGSHGEIIQDKRGLQDNTQEVMLRNAEIDSNLRTAVFQRTCGGGKYGGSVKYPSDFSNGECPHGYSQRVNIVDAVGDHNDRANVALDGKLQKVRTGSNPSIYETIGDEDTPEEVARSGGSNPVGVARREMGTALHKQWQDDYKRDNPKEKKRWKDKNPDGSDLDSEWVAKNGPRVDILSTDFDDLPPGWQKENLDAATFAVETVETSDTEEEAASLIHDDWKRRNPGKAEDRPDLFVDYADLSDEEKEKDLQHVRKAAAKIGKTFTSPEVTEQKLFINYLQGQRKLLEALLNQTTSNPNT